MPPYTCVPAKTGDPITIMFVLRVQFTSVYVQDTYYIDVQAFTYTNVMTYAARIYVSRRLLQDDFLANLISAQLSRPMRHRWFIDRVRIIGHTVDFIRDFVIRVNSHSKHAQSRNTIHSNCPSKHKLTKSMPKRSTRNPLVLKTHACNGVG